VTVVAAEDLLDDPDAITAADPDGMLDHVMAAPAQLREAAYVARDTDLSSLSASDRPRSIVVAGMGGSAIAGDVLGAVAGTSCPVPIVTVRGYTLPGWVGAADLVMGVSCSGTTEETLALLDQAVRRGSRVMTVGAADSPIAELGAAGRGPHIPVPGGRPPRASIWALSVPLLVAGEALGLVHCPPVALEEAADVLDQLTERYKTSKDSFLNPAKALALSLASRLPMAWGTSPLAGVAAYRFACQAAENAKAPALWAVLPEANHNAVVAFDMEGVETTLVLLRDSEEHPQVAKRADVSAELARDRGLEVEVVTADGVSPIARLASLVAYADFVTAYLALVLGVDPSPVATIESLKDRIRQ
jgi:glucose/mannose-6-phosphate isomerase